MASFSGKIKIFDENQLKKKKGLGIFFSQSKILVALVFLSLTVLIVFVLINPTKKSKKEEVVSRDTERKEQVIILGQALNDYYQSQDEGLFVPETGCDDGTGTIGFLDCLVLEGLLATELPLTIYARQGSYACTGIWGNAQNGYCYDATSREGQGPVIAFVSLETEEENAKCLQGQAFYVWSSDDNRDGLVCRESEPTPGQQVWE